MFVIIAPSERNRAHRTYRSGLRLPSRLFAHALIASITFLSACRDDPSRNDSPDGGMMTDGGVVEEWSPEHPAVKIMQCATPTQTDTCVVSGSGSSTLLVGTVLTADTVYEGGKVLVDGSGVISCVGCDCDATGAKQVDCGSAAISPALINGHDHITFVQNDPFTQTGERYEHRHDWRTGARDHTEVNSEGSATREEKIWGELRFVIGGGMSVNGSGTSDGLLRNLDRSSGNEGLGQPEVEYDTFPLDDTRGTLLASGCDYGSSVTTPDDVANANAYTPHISEGIDVEARNEFLCLSEGDLDLIDNRTGVIHGTGLLAPDIAEMAREKASLIWSPRTNISLYGDTARVTTYATLGVNIALGTDWIVSGSMNMLRELQCVDQLNRDNFGGYFADSQIWLMATRNAARALGVDQVLGELKAGQIADIAVFADKGADNPFRSVIEADPSTVLLVMRQGKALYGDQGAVETLGDGACEAMDVCGSAKSVCLSGDTGITYASLQQQLGSSIYPLFSCDTPPNEPTCTPMRPQETVPGYSGIPTDGDSDGDGIPDSADNCAQVFNPVRPVDIDAQADADQDGVGDECDQCPVSAEPGACGELPESDSDSDGIPNSADNCPNEPNMDQADADNDQVGDACDFCPDVANPDGAGCPASVYDIKDGTVPLDAAVSVTDLLVTALAPNGFYAQLSANATDFDGVEGSGIFIYTGGAPEGVARGDLVDITQGIVGVFHEQIQLGSPTFAVKASGQALPAPVAQTPAGLKAAILDYDGILVELTDTTVTALDPDAAGLFTVGGAVVVSDFLYAITPRPPVDHRFQRLTGISHRWDEEARILPRDESDFETDEIPVPTSDLTLLINELDYDQPGDDINEFLEIYNNGGSDVDLSEVEVIRINGSGGAEYGGGRIQLSGTLAPGGYFVVGSDTLTVDGGAMVQREFTKDGLQNGPDAVALYDKTAGAVIDAVAYEGEVPSALPLVEGTPIPATVADANDKEGSLCRVSNGGDTGDDATDFGFCATPTPGAANTL